MRTFSKTPARLLLVALSVAGSSAALAAHGNAKASTPATGAPRAPVSSASGAYALATISTKPGASQPNADPNATLTLNLGNEVASADPQVLNGINEIAVASSVFVPLLALTTNDKVASAGATRMDVSADGKTYTFTLRPGMAYTDGKPVTAADYAYAIKRACDPVVGGNYSNIVFDVVGCAEWRSADTSKTSTSGLRQLAQTVDNAIKALDASTLRIRLKQAAGYFPYVMTTWITFPSRPDLVQKGGANWWKNPHYYIGDGPFKLASWTPNQQWVFTRNDTYFRGKPGIKTLVDKEISSSQTQLLAYTQGQFDAIGPDPTLLPQIESNGALKQQLLRTVNAETTWLSFNNAVAPFNNIKVRQAISDALDRQRYINQVANGVGKPAGSLLYPGIPGYQAGTQQAYVPSKAQSLLAQAGYPNGRGFPTQQLRYASDNPASKQRATFWAQDLKQALNIDIQPTPMDAAQLQKMEFNRDPSLKLSFGDWYQDYPHPQDWLTLVFANGSTRAPNGWNDAHFNALVNKADQLPIDQAAPLYQQADAYLATQAPVAFYLHDESLVLVKPTIKGYVNYPADLFDTTFQAEKIYKTTS